MTTIPEKTWFKIGEVARLAGIKPYVLRYWETEFSEIAPVKSRHNHRLYRRGDVEAVLAIRDLLYERKFTIEGARRALRERSRPAAAQTEPAPAARSDELAGMLVDVRAELTGLLRLVE